MTTLTKPTTQTPINMLPKENAVRALNQLASIIAGRTVAIATNGMEDTPSKRVEAMTKIVGNELQEAIESGNGKEIKSATRRLESLASLKDLSQLVDEVEWD